MWQSFVNGADAFAMERLGLRHLTGNAGNLFVLHVTSSPQAALLARGICDSEIRSESSISGLYMRIELLLYQS